MLDDRFIFTASIEPSETLMLTTDQPELTFPAGCEGSASGSKSYNVTCRGPVYSRLVSYIDYESRRIELHRADVPFDIVRMSVSYEAGIFGDANGLGVKVRPNSKTESDMPVNITVYDEGQKSRGRKAVVWTRPELNANSEKFIAPFTLSRNEIDAYSTGDLLSGEPDMDLRPFFSVLMDDENFDSNSPDVKAWIQRNVLIRIEPVPSSTLGTTR